MLGRGIRVLAPAILFGLVGFYRVAFPPVPGVVSHLKDLPPVILGLKGEDVPVGQAIVDDLDSDELLIRRYWRPDGTPVWVVVIYFVNMRRGGHDPELCYRSQGYHTSDLPERTVTSAEGVVRAESFLARRPGRSERVLTFWYAPGGRIVSDVRSYRRLLFLQGLRQNRTYGAFVRISTLDGDRPDEAESWNERFVAEIARYLPQLIRG
jgi:EpsI family protein